MRLWGRRPPALRRQRKRCRLKSRPLSPRSSKRVMDIAPPVQPPVTPIVKRRRSTKTSPGVGSSSGVKSEADGLESTSVGDLENSSPPGRESANKTCPGCHRNASTARCYINPEEPVQWALPLGRGAWCRDCHNTWRLWFYPRTQLSAFPAHLQKPDMRNEFDCALIAYVSLRRAKHERIAYQLLAERIDLITWLMQTLSLPLHPFVVAPLAEVTELQSASQIVMMSTAGGPVLGAMVQPPRSIHPSATAFIKPDGGFGMCMSSRRTVYTTNQADFRKLSELLGSPARPSTATYGDAFNICKSEPLANIEVASRSAKKLSQRVRLAISSAALLLHNFESNEWEDVKESAFTAPLQRLHEAKLEACHEQVEPLIRETEKWHAAIADIKMFLKNYKEAMRSRHGQNLKLGNMIGVASRSFEFLSERIEPNLTLCLAFLKCQFHFGSDDERDMPERVRSMIDVHLKSSLAAMEVASLNSADGWLRALFIGYLSKRIEDMTSDDVDSSRRTLLAELGEVIPMVESCSHDGSLNNIIKDLAMLRVICGAGVVPEARFADAAAAEAHVMNSARRSLMKKALSDSPAGKEFLAPIGQMRMTSMNDDLAAQRLSGALACFEDDAMMRVSFHAGVVSGDGDGNPLPVYIIENGDLATGTPMLIDAMLQDAMANVVESAQLWPQATLEANEDKLLLFAGKLISTLASIELVIISRAYAHCMTSPVALPSEDPLQDLTAAQGILCNTAAKMSTLHAGSTLDLLAKIRNLEGPLRNCPVFCQMLHTAASVAESNHSIKQTVFDMLALLTPLAAAGLVASGACAIEQWRSRGDQSCLKVCLSIVDQAHALREAKDLCFMLISDPSRSAQGRAASNDAIVKFAGEPDTPEMKMSQIIDFPKALASSGIVKWASRLLHSSLGAAIDGCFASMELDGLSLLGHEMRPDDKSSLSDICKDFISARSFTTSVSKFTKEIAAGNHETLELPSVAAAALVSEIIEGSFTQVVRLGPPFASAKCDVPALMFEKVLSLYTDMHHIATCLAWISVSCPSHAACLVNNTLKKELESAIDVIETHTTTAKQTIDDFDAEFGIDRAMPGMLKYPINVCRMWVHNVSATNKILRKNILRSIAYGINSLTKMVEAHTPKYNHFLNDQQCSAKLARSKLLAFASKEVLTKETVSLFHSLAEFSRMKTKYSFERTEDAEATEEDEFHETRSCANSAFAASKLAVSIIAAAHW